MNGLNKNLTEYIFKLRINNNQYVDEGQRRPLAQKDAIIWPGKDYDMVKKWGN